MSIREDAIMMLLSGEGGSADVAELIADENTTYNANEYTNIDGKAVKITIEGQKPLDGFDPVDVSLVYKKGQQDPSQEAAWEKWCKNLITQMFPEAEIEDIPIDDDDKSSQIVLVDGLSVGSSNMSREWKTNEPCSGFRTMLITKEEFKDAHNNDTYTFGLVQTTNDSRMTKAGENDGNRIALAVFKNGVMVTRTDLIGNAGFWEHCDNEFSDMQIIRNGSILSISCHVSGVQYERDSYTKIIDTYDYDTSRWIRLPSDIAWDNPHSYGYSTITT